MENQHVTDLHTQDADLPGSSAKPFELERWAQLLADGGAPWPADLPPATAERLVARVNQLRRRRLVKLIANAIANDISSTGKGVPKEPIC